MPTRDLTKNVRPRLKLGSAEYDYVQKYFYGTTGVDKKAFLDYLRGDLDVYDSTSVRAGSAPKRVGP